MDILNYLITITFNGNRVAGLFERYHSNKMKRLTSKPVLSCALNLSFVQKQNFTPRNKIFLNNKNYCVLESNDQNIFDGGLRRIKMIEDANLTLEEVDSVVTPKKKPLIHLE